MVIEQLAFPAAILVSLTGVVLLLSRDWRLSISALAVQYSGVFALVVLSWSTELAAVKLVAGWMAGAVLGMALAGRVGEPIESDRLELSGLLFRLFSAVLVWLVVYSLAPVVTIRIPEITLTQAIGGLALIGMGLLHLGLTNQPLRVTLGLLTVLAGFEILYAAVEPSSLLSGLLAAVNLGLALVGAYLLTGPGEEEKE